VSYQQAIQAVQATPTRNGRTVKDVFRQRYGQRAETGWVAVGPDQRVTVEFQSMPDGQGGRVYRWLVEDNQVQAINGHAIGLSPDAYNGPLIEQHKRLVAHSTEVERAVYEFVSSRMREYAKDHEDGMEQHFEAVLVEAAQHFGKPVGEVAALYDWAEKVAFGIATTR
jgi:hypothetical protein